MEEAGGAQGLVSLPADTVARMEKLVRKYGIVPPNGPPEDEQEEGGGAVEALESLLTEMRSFHKLASMLGYRDWVREGRGPAQYCLDKVLCDGGPRLLRVYNHQKAQTGEGPLSHKLRGHLEVFLVENKWCGDKGATTWVDRAMHVIQEVLSALGLGAYQLQSYRDVEAFCLTYRDDLYYSAYEKDYPRGKEAKKGSGSNEKFLQPYHGLFCWATGADHSGLDHLPEGVREDALAKRKAATNTKAAPMQDRTSTGKAKTVSVKRTSTGKAKASPHYHHSASESGSGSDSCGYEVSPQPIKKKARPPSVSHPHSDPDYTDSDVETRPFRGFLPSASDLPHDISMDSDSSMELSNHSDTLPAPKSLSKSLRKYFRIHLRTRDVGQDTMERTQMIGVLEQLIKTVSRTVGEGSVVLGDERALKLFLTTHLDDLKAAAREGDRAGAPVVSTRVCVLSEALGYVGLRDATLPPPTDPRPDVTVLPHVKHEHN